MSFTGTVRNGVVILPPDAKLPEGAQVEVVARLSGTGISCNNDSARLTKVSLR